MSTSSIRTLFVTKTPYPPRGGAPLRNWQNINVMMQFGPVEVFSICGLNSNYKSLENPSFWHSFDFAVQPSTQTLIETGIQWLRRYGLTYYCTYLNSAAQKLEKILLEFQPDLVFFEELWLYYYLPVVKRYKCQIILDEHNVEAPLYQETKCKQSGLIAWLRTKLHVPQIRSVESNFVKQANQVWLCSEEDKQLLQKLYGPVSHSYVVPNGISLKYYQGVRSERCSFPDKLQKKNRNIIFPGNFFYLPNSEAAHLLITEIYPQIRKYYPDCQLFLVGYGATPTMQEAAHQSSGIIVTGEVPDIRPYLSAASVMVVPLLNGGGTRFKLLEAFAAGLPVVSTAKGAEGLRAQDGEHLLIRDRLDEIVDGIHQLWSAPELGERMADSAYALVKSEYSWEAVGQKVERALADLFSNFDEESSLYRKFSLQSESITRQPRQLGSNSV